MHYITIVGTIISAEIQAAIKATALKLNWSDETLKSMHNAC